MNVTIKIADDLCRAARHRAVDRGLSLSSWIAEVVGRELATPDGESRGLLESLAMEGDQEFEIPRDQSGAREVEFS